MSQTPNPPETSAPRVDADARHDIGLNPSLNEVFFAFLIIGLMGFGGLAPASYHMLVERKKWYSPKDYVELFAICSILPGGNILNASIMIGNRFQGLAGAIAALSALMLAPLIILICLALTYDHFSYIADVRAAIVGGSGADHRDSRKIDSRC